MVSVPPKYKSTCTQLQFVTEYKSTHSYIIILYTHSFSSYPIIMLRVSGSFGKSVWPQKGCGQHSRAFSHSGVYYVLQGSWCGVKGQC